MTFNVNFNNNATKISQDIAKLPARADIIMFQEVKWVTVADYLPAADWYVYQVTNSGDARRGSAVAVRRSIMSGLYGAGLHLGVAAGDADMLDRYIAWVEIALTNGQRIRVMSLHMPPQRYVELQTPMANSLAGLVNSIEYPVVVGGDWNFTVNNDPRGITQKTRLLRTGIGIDGFYYERKAVSVSSTNRLSGLNVNSDHDPVQIITQVYNLTPVSAVGDWAIY